jgi:hypothetical protein
MKKYFTLALRKLLPVILLLVFTCSTGIKSRATAWTTGIVGSVTNLMNWTNGTSSPTSFITPGDTWAITLPMTIPATGVWTVGSSTIMTASVLFAAGGSITDTMAGATPVINIYGSLIGNGGTYNITGINAAPVFNVYGNANINNGSFNASGSGTHFTFNSYGNFNMAGGVISATGNSSINKVNFYGNCSLTGLSAMVSSGTGSKGSVHFTHPSSSGVGLIDNSSIGAWSGMDFYVDSGCAAQLDGDFTTSTGTVANGLSVNGTLICPSAYHVTDTNSFNVNRGGTLIVADPMGINGPIITTGTMNFSDSASYGFNGTVPQVTGSYLPATLYAPDTIKIMNNTGVTLSQNTSTTGVLTFTSGILYTGLYTITLPGTATSVTGAGTTSYVNGTLVKNIAGDTVVNYEVGESTYAPMQLKFDAMGTGGSISVMANYGLHPSAGSSTLSTSYMVNHYWTLASNSPAGPGRVKVKATYPFPDIIGGSNLYFVTQQYDGSLWLTSPLPSTNTSSPYTTTTDTGILLGALPGDYIFGRRTGALSTGTVAGATNATLQLFPDPNSGTFTMNVSSDDNEEVAIVITNVIGEKVRELRTTTNQPVDITLESPGIYFLSANTARNNCTAKIIVR